MSSDEIRQERLRKLGLLQAAGMDPYPAQSNQTITAEHFLEQFEDAGTQSLTGRILSMRAQGGIVFATLFDGTGKMQIVLQKAEMDEALFTLFHDAIDQGDFVECTGTPYTTKRGEKSLKVDTWKILAKSLSALPSEWFGIKDEETRLRERYLDILLNPEVRAMFERRSRFWLATRTFLLEKGFIEVETPVLENTPGGADARPFKTHHHALDMEVYLRISAGELWQKKLLIAGFPKVFEIGRIFRNEGQSREHLQDYTQLETYEAYSDIEKGKVFVRDLYRHLAQETYGKQNFVIHGHEVDLSVEWTEVDFATAIQERFGLDPVSEIYEKTGTQVTQEDLKEICTAAGIPYDHTEFNIARTVDNLWKIIRKTIAGPAFLTGVPVYLEPLAKRSTSNPKVVQRLQVLMAGSEVGKGFSELNDPQDQEKRFEAQQAMRDAGDDEAQRLDRDYIKAMEYGMPPAFGFGVSERLFAFLEDKPAHETQLFPLLRPKQD